MTAKRLRYLAVAGALAICGWLGLGWEKTSIDHQDRYMVFIKSYPSTQVFFRSYLSCDECDAASYQALPPDRKVEFADFCRAKYGFDDPRLCDAIYKEKLRINLERLSQPIK